MSSQQDELKETDTEARFEFKKEEKSAFQTEKGLTEETVRVISEDKDEPVDAGAAPARALEQFQEMPMPTDWPGQPDLSEVDIDEIIPYIRPDVDVRAGVDDWTELPDEIKDTFDKLGIPEAEKNALSGVGAQYESEVVYQNMQEQWEEKGVIFCNMDEAVREHEEIVREHFMTKCVPPSDNKFAALHGAIWSGGSFVYVPENTTVDMPIQAYFRMNSKGWASSSTRSSSPRRAPKSTTSRAVPRRSTRRSTSTPAASKCSSARTPVQSSTHGAELVEEHVQPEHQTRHRREGRAHGVDLGIDGVESDDAVPSTILKGRGASDNHITIAFAGEGQDIDTGAKVYHNAPNTKTVVESKSIAKDGGRTNYRGLVHIADGAENSSTAVECDALMFDNKSTSDTMPYMEINESKVDVAHEATVGKIGDEDIFYLQSRGLDDDDAKQMIVSGFIEPITEELPIEYAVELNRLVELEMEGSLG